MKYAVFNEILCWFNENYSNWGDTIKKIPIFATAINLMAIKLTTVKLNMIGYEILR